MEARPYVWVLWALVCCSATLTMLSTASARDTDVESVCNAAKTCGRCIAANPDCAWCAEETYESHGVNRCMTKLRLFDTGRQGCRGRWYSPDSYVVTNNPSLLADTTKISPVAAKFKLRPGATESITASVKVRPEHVKRGKMRCKLRVKSDVMASISSRCRGFRRRKSAFVCYGPFKENQIILFNITIRAKRCMKKTGRVKLRVFPGKDTKLAIKIRSVCRCRCESGAQKILRDIYCSSHGDKVCGHCECHVNYHGKRCECRGKEQPLDSCTLPNTTSVCSGIGVCMCGKCQCNTKSHYGKYCECVDTNCDRYDGQLCGGMNRGRCMCGRCVCQKGFIGAACHIPTTTDGCVSSKGKVCDGRGACINGYCQCRVPYHGRTCEECLTCGGKCAELQACVQCTVFLNGPLESRQCSAKCSWMKIDIVDLLQEGDGERRTCVYTDPVDESYVFFQESTTGVNNTDVVLTVQRSKA